MSLPPFQRRSLALVILCCLATPALADTSFTSHTAQGGERLGDWLMQLQASSVAQRFDPATQWLRPSEIPAQRAFKDSLIKDIQDRSTEALRTARLVQHLSSLPTTGRILLPMSDSSLLPVHPESEPVMKAGDILVLSERPSKVAILRDDGTRCDAVFVPGALAADYLRGCQPSEPFDEIWLVQPEGRIERLGVSDWNSTRQSLPAPGAWLWVPGRDRKWTEPLNRDLATLLATQGPLFEAHGTVTRPAPKADAAITAYPREARISANDWGISGLLQTASARLPKAGQTGVTISRADPYTRYSANLSPFDNVEIAVRYTRIANRLYGPAEFSGDRAYLDKSSEIKFGLISEGPYMPAVSVGLRDPGGTGLFGGEYVVASKRSHDLDFSLGLGWGYAGARSNLPNPLGVLGDRFKTRKSADVGQGGTAQLGTLFTGRTALFGGVQWNTPWEPWLVKFEFDGNHYRAEPFGSDLHARSPFNAALVWRKGPLEVSLGWLRGRELQFALSLQSSLPSLTMAKHSVRPHPPVHEITLAAAKTSILTATSVATMSVSPPPEFRETGAEHEMSPSADVGTSEDSDPASKSAREPSPPILRNEVVRLSPQVLRELSAQTGWTVTRIEARDSLWQITLEDSSGALKRERLDRAAAVLHPLTPASVKTWRWKFQSRDVEVQDIDLDRQQWMDLHTRWDPQQHLADGLRPSPIPAAEKLFVPAPSRYHSKSDAQAQPPLVSREPANASKQVRLGYQQVVGGPDGYLYAVTGVAQGRVRLGQGLWAQGSAQLRLFDNYENFRNAGSSDLPRVRTYVREYMVSSRLTVPNLQLAHFARWSENIFSLAYAGWLEPMFAGIGGEVMWRPSQSRWAVTMDINRVGQRDFDQRYALLDYRVTSGHLGVHWTDPDRGYQVQVFAGQYLAGDRGATVDLSRVFRNGTRIGAWVTKTNVSAEQFGEGSFDKGVYVSIPFDTLFSSWSGGYMNTVWQPLIRDGGARLARGVTLMGLTSARSSDAMKFEAPPPQPATWSDLR